MSGIIVDLFAGGGGTSLGIEWALGRSPDVAVNHSAEAVAMHIANHPEAQHLCGNVWDYAPRDIAAGREVELLWASPDCRHFSKAKGGKPRDQKIRSLAWVAVRWAKEVRPAWIMIENVEELQQWGPLLNDGTPCPARKGLTFRRWVRALEKEGYRVEWRELRGCDYGAPTSRKRLFVIARRGGGPISWPTATHAPSQYRTAAECIDWTIRCPSIFGRKKPLREPTLRRIARGIRKFVIDAAEPFIVPGPSAPTLIHQGNGERDGQAPRIYDIRRPLGTVVAQGVKHALVSAFLAKHYGGNYNGNGSDLREPMSTITTQDHHALVTCAADGDRRAEVRSFLTKFYGTAVGQDLQLPLGTITTRDRFGLVMVEGQAYEIADIGMRMLTPRELFRAQGFPDAYVIDPPVNGKPLTKTAQIRMCGNSVVPQLAAAIVGANVGSSVARGAA